jgi:NTP pyrophosphatase (non-canonical NTP hydrolase)
MSIQENSRNIPFWERTPRSAAKPKGSWLETKSGLLTQTELALVVSNSEMADSLSQIQREVGEWAWRNFKEKATGLNPHLGVIEELGELAKAVLKKDQGIRGTPDKHDADAVDAIGDIMIYLLNLLNTIEVDVFEVASSIYLSTASFVSDDRYSILDRKKLIVLMSKSVATISDDKGSLGNLLVYLDVMSRSYGYSLIGVVNKTWEIVRRRNWVDDAIVGGGHTH